MFLVTWRWNIGIKPSRPTYLRQVQTSPSDEQVWPSQRSICSGFDVASNVTPVTVIHSTKSADKDQHTMVDVLHSKHHVFSSEGSHSKFPNFKRNHLSHIDRKKFDKCIQGHIQKFSKLQAKQLKISQQNPQESITTADTGALSLILELEEEWDITD